MSSSRDRLALRLAVAAAIAAFALSACGRKSGLDLPPSASLADTPNGAQGGTSSQPAQDEWGADRPLAPKGPDRRTPLDWLID